jgi:phosphatidylinositol alpha-1,6-mannosyltransferase
LDPSRVKVLPNTVAESFRPIDKSRARKRIGLGNEKVLLTVGRLLSSEQYKGHDCVIACLPDILRYYPDIIYLVAGTGDDEARLVKIAETLGVREHLIFLGHVGDDELPFLYSAVDLFVMPSTGEGFGIVFIEAMASGTPALGLNMAGSVDALQDGQLGLLSSREDICSTILQALKSCRKEGLSGRVQATFGRDNFNRHVQRLLSTCLFKTDPEDRTAKLRLSCAG